MDWRIFMILPVSGFLCSSLAGNDVIADFFRRYDIYHGIILNCYSKKDQVRLLQRVFPIKDVLMSSVNIHETINFELLNVKHGRIGMVLDGECEDSKKIILQYGERRFFDIKYYWLILTNLESDYLFSGANTNVDSNIFLIPSEPWLKNPFDVYEFYNPASLKGGTAVKTRIGLYNNSTGYPKNGVDKFWQRRNLSGITFDTTLVLHEPYSGTLEEYMQSNNKREENTYSRFHARLMKFCKEHYKFGLRINVTTLYGYQKGDGTMDGLVGDLERRLVEFGISPLFIRKDRANVITYGRLTYTLRSAFVFLNPKSKAMFEVFLRPLAPTVWYCLLGFSAFAILAIKWTMSLTNINRSDSSWSYCVLCLIGILSQQGTTAIPSTLSARIAILFTLILSYVIYIFYSGSLVSSLLNIPQDLINSVEDMLNANFKIGIENNRFNREYFKYTEDNTSKRLYNALIKGKEYQVYQNVTSGVEKIRDGHYAFHLELVKAYSLIKKRFKENLCDIREVFMYKPPHFHANYAKHSSFRDIMDVCLHRIAENGVMRKELTFWHTVKPECAYVYEISTGIAEISAILISMLVAFQASVLVLIFEVIFVKFVNIM